MIAGAGLSGLLLAVACAGAGLEVAVVDPQDPAAMLEEGFDGRTSAIAYGSRLVFDGIGLWPKIAAAAEPIREIRVADDDSPLFLHYDARDLGEPVTPLGYIVENRVLRRALLDMARALPHLRLLDAAPHRRRSRRAGPAPPRCSTPASGCAPGWSPPPTARIRRCAAPPASAPIEWRYRQTGIVTTVAHERPHAGIAVEHFLPAGPFAILPMTGTAPRSCGPRMPIWRRASSPCRKRNSPPNSRARFGDFLGEIEPVGPRWAYPLALMQAERYAARRLALVGEAAHVIHPIAGQGLNIGIRDVAVLAELIVDQRRLGLDIGDDGVLRALPALAARRRALAGGRHRRAQPPVLQYDPAASASPAISASRWSTGCRR